MEGLSISSQAAGLQTPVSRIESLAMASQEMLEDLFPQEDESNRRLLSHLINFADLIVVMTQQLAKEAEAIEIAAHNLEKAGDQA
jgi:hypothetical protein